MSFFFYDIFKANASSPAIVWKDEYYTYNDILVRIKIIHEFINDNAIHPGDIVSVKGDFTPSCIALILSLINNDNIIVPLTYGEQFTEEKKLRIAQVEHLISVDLDTDELSYMCLGTHNELHPFFVQLNKAKTSGLVLFSSGTSGEPKAAVHQFPKLLEKFRSPRPSLKTINFLLFDHWGGLNTLFHTLSNAGVVLATRERKPDVVCSFIEKYKVELLPTSPTFLNLILLSEIYKKYDLSSLKLITYGTEPMPQATLIKAKNIFPNVKFQQTYGLIELGVLRSKSKADDSLWVKLGGEGYALRVIENILQIKADSAMLGYLNAPSPFTEDGYFITGDEVEQDGEYFKILGRKSELINVGGEKVYPQEVENVIIAFPGIKDVTVYSEKHAITGNIVCAKINIENSSDPRQLVKDLKQHCKKQLQSYKVPVKINIIDSPLHSIRFKKKRNQ